MRLWMIATQSVLEELRHEQTMWVDPSRIDGEFFGAAYQWMRRQMAQRLTSYHGHFPWWAWYRWYPHTWRPDLRNRQLHSGNWPAGAPLVHLELEIPPERLLLSDFDLWHFVLNHQYLSWNAAQWEAFRAEWEATPAMQRDIDRLDRSWERIFDLEYPLADPAWLGTLSAERIQATFEELRASDVRHVTYFKARPPKPRPITDFLVQLPEIPLPFKG